MDHPQDAPLSQEEAPTPRGSTAKKGDGHLDKDNKSFESVEREFEQVRSLSMWNRGEGRIDRTILLRQEKMEIDLGLAFPHSLALFVGDDKNRF